jgi:NAD(P) transhydrogenase
VAVEPYDLVILGSGPAGEKGATQAAYFGKRVALVERQSYVGGTSINTGTIPSKTLRETALYFSGLSQRGLYGVDYTVKADLTVRDFMFREREVVTALRSKVAENLVRHNVTVVPGTGSFEDPHTIRVRSDDHPDRLLRGRVILIATGSRPFRAPEIPFDDRLILDSDSILRMDRLPRSLAVVGAGVIGCEYASMFSALGIEVTLVGGRDRIVPFLDNEISDRLRLQMELLGTRVRVSTNVERCECMAEDCARLYLSDQETLEVDKVLIAAGRLGNTDGLDLQKVGVTADPRGLIKVNEHYQTAVPHIYAAGDVIGFPALAAVSMEQARVAMCHAFDIKFKTRVSPMLPLAIYTIPEVAMAGETEETCQQKHLPYCVGRALYGNNARGQIIGDLAGQIKLIFSPADQSLFGVHVIGEIASELIHIGTACLQLGGTLDFFIQSVFNYPTLGEAYKYAAYDGLQNLARFKAGEPPFFASRPADERGSR